MLMMRWQIAHPGVPVPLVGPLLEKVCWATWPAKGSFPTICTIRSGRCTGRSWCSWRSCRWLSALSAISWCRCRSARRIWRFPRVNMASYQFYVLGGVIMFFSFFIPGGAAQAGWTSYSPLATSIPTDGQTFWLIGMVLLITSSLLGAVNFIATDHSIAGTGNDLDAVAVLSCGRNS